MGQRTQMIIQRVNNKGEKRTEVWHLQWGYGRIMYLNLMGLLIQDYFKETFEKDYSFLNGNDKIKPALRPYDITHEFSAEQLNELNELDFSEPAKVGDILRCCNNNNGGCFVRITEDEKEYHNAHIQFAFMTGYESGGAYDKFVTLEEYAKKEGFEYTKGGFIPMFKKFISYFDIEDMAQPKPQNEGI